LFRFCSSSGFFNDLLCLLFALIGNVLVIFGRIINHEMSDHGLFTIDVSDILWTGTHDKNAVPLSAKFDIVSSFPFRRIPTEFTFVCPWDVHEQVQRSRDIVHRDIATNCLAAL
jgi:hypothetical protein